jgi:NAD+ diphosphatase
MPIPFVSAVAPLLPAADSALWFVCGADGLLVDHQPDQTRLPNLDQLAGLLIGPEAAHYLGRLADRDCFAQLLPPSAVLPPPLSVRGLRKLAGVLPDDVFAIAGRAVQIIHWDDTHRFCGRCATPLERLERERAKRCPACQLAAYPRLSPAVIVLVRRGDQALLARGNRFPIPMYSTLAGFVEPGESLEDTIHREIGEEVGIQVQNLRYFGSQPWPFPHSLMVGFFADYAGGELRPDGDEIIDAKWCSATALPPIPPRLSIARRLIDAWLAEVAAGGS